jgi:hypothetical protein
VSEFRLLEVLIMEIEPHPLEVKQGDFGYWNTLATHAGIDLNNEARISNEFQEADTEYCGDDSPTP